MAYKLTFTTSNNETFSTDYDNIDDLAQSVNQVAGFYGDHNLVAVSDEPFIGVKFKDIHKIEVAGISRTALRKYIQEKMAKEQAEKEAAYRAQNINYPNTVGLASQCESAGTRLI